MSDYVDLINSLDCFKILKEDNGAKLIDVRTQPEWEFVGIPDLSSINKKPIFVSWELYPDMNINNNFKNEIMSSNINKYDLIFFLCRSGNRSLKAAEYLITQGYRKCFNVFDGFEGNKNSKNHRSTSNGWKYNQLPWTQ